MSDHDRRQRALNHHEHALTDPDLTTNDILFTQGLAIRALRDQLDALELELARQARPLQLLHRLGLLGRAATLLAHLEDLARHELWRYDP